MSGSVVLQTPVKCKRFICVREEDAKKGSWMIASARLLGKSSNFKVLQVTQMGPYNILAALQESYDCHCVTP